MKVKDKHEFNGDNELLRRTAGSCDDVKHALTALQKTLQRVASVPTQVTAEIRLNVAGPTPKEHIYTVSITDSLFDSEHFERTKQPARPAKRQSTAGPTPAGSPPVSGHADNRSSSASQPVVVDDEDNVSERRPAKRARIGANEPVSEDLVERRLDDILNFVENWRTEWKAQGGWLFDQLNTDSKTAANTKAELEQKLDSVQDILGQSINGASSTTMTELSNVTKLLPWLEHCRKTSTDKTEAREEKWRSSSASFHDQSRRDREAAEKRLEEKLEFQQRLLVKIAESNGIDLDDMTEARSRSSSLGAQLTAELSLEATRAARNEGRGKNQGNHGQPINVDD